MPGEEEEDSDEESVTEGETLSDVSMIDVEGVEDNVKEAEESGMDVGDISEVAAELKGVEVGEGCAALLVGAVPMGTSRRYWSARSTCIPYTKDRAEASRTSDKPGLERCFIIVRSRKRQNRGLALFDEANAAIRRIGQMDRRCFQVKEIMTFGRAIKEKQ